MNMLAAISMSMKKNCINVRLASRHHLFAVMSHAKRLKALGKENDEKKNMLAQSMLENRVLKEVNAKKIGGLPGCGIFESDELFGKTRIIESGEGN